MEAPTQKGRIAASAFGWPFSAYSVYPIATLRCRPGKVILKVSRQVLIDACNALAAEKQASCPGATTNYTNPDNIGGVADASEVSRALAAVGVNYKIVAPPFPAPLAPSAGSSWTINPGSCENCIPTEASSSSADPPTQPLYQQVSSYLPMTSTQPYLSMLATLPFGLACCTCSTCCACAKCHAIMAPSKESPRIGYLLLVATLWSEDPIRSDRLH